jgi:hypothetical protein
MHNKISGISVDDVERSALGGGEGDFIAQAVQSRAQKAKNAGSSSTTTTRGPLRGSAGLENFIFARHFGSLPPTADSQQICPLLLFISVPSKKGNTHEWPVSP